MKLTNGTRVGHYDMVTLLGSGGMGDVYLARDTRLGRDVAVKFLRSDLEADEHAMKRLLREAQTAAQLDHPNICTIYEIGEADGRSFIVMQYVDGETLAARVARAPLDLPNAVTIAAQIAAALAEAHHHGLVHRDVKPQNIMLSKGGEVKVLDFGLAKIAAPSDADLVTASSLTATGVVAGTVPYMSPEQARGEALDARSDVFSFGTLLHEVLSGRHPFKGANAADTVSAILMREAPALQRDPLGAPPDLQRIVRKCLEKDVTRRYQSTQDLVIDLHNVQRELALNVVGPGLGDVRHHNLPEQLTSFIGRERELEDLRRLLSSFRLVTLAGAGGCGKTRLALRLAGDLMEQFTDGVWVVDLAPLADPDLVIQTVAAVLDVREGPNRSLADALWEYCRHRHFLLVLDNCEHLIAACAQLGQDLLRVAPNLHILATSREALGIAGEHVWRVPSLSLMDSDRTLSTESLLESEAARLFVDRATAVDPAFTVTPANVAAIAEVCQRLDAIPLAIELAAARVKMLSVDQINVRLKDRFRLLTGGSRTAVARQRTLEATVDWSYELLSESERRLLSRLSVFPGSLSLEAAEHVCTGDGIERDDMLDLLSRLVDKSLVIVEDERTGDRRYRLLETVRQYGRDRLLRSNEAEAVRDRHAAFFLALARRAGPELIRAHQVTWLNTVQLDHDNLRSALDWYLAAPERANAALELAGAVWWFWVKRGLFSEGRMWLERTLAGADAPSPQVKMKALVGLVHVAQFQGDFERIKDPLDQSLAIAREAGDLPNVGWILGMQAIGASELGDVEQSARLAAEGLAAARAGGGVWEMGLPLRMLAFASAHDGDYDRASSLFEESIQIYRRGDRGDQWPLSIMLSDLAAVRVLQGRHRDAKALACESLRLSEQLGDRRGVGWALFSLAAAQVLPDQSARAARLWGASEGVLEAVGAMPQASVRWLVDRYRDIANESIGTPAFQSALAEGRAMPLKQAMQLALEDEACDRPL